jgi:hypothetical protein
MSLMCIPEPFALDAEHTAHFLATVVAGDLVTATDDGLVAHVPAPTPGPRPRQERLTPGKPRPQQHAVATPGARGGPRDCPWAGRVCLAVVVPEYDRARAVWCPPGTTARRMCAATW